jgi:hypothetical protein
MTRNELAAGSATFIAVALAGWVSVVSVDRHFAATTSDGSVASSTPCVGADGSWKNWVWGNVPMLSPKCADKH